MERQLLSRVEKRVLSSMLICCLWTCAVPASARAAASFSAAQCYVTKVTMGGHDEWSIRGTASVKDLVPPNASVTVTFTFQRKANGAKNWTNVSGTVQQTTNGINGNANFDSKGLSLPPPG